MLSWHGGGTHNWAEGAVFLQPSIRCNYKWPRAEGWGSQSDLGSHVNLRPTVSWLWQQDFTSIIQIPKAKAILHFANSNQRGRVYKSRDTEKSGRIRTESQWMKTLRQGWNQSRSQSHFDPSKHLAGVIVAIHWTVRHISTSLCKQSFLADRRGLFLMIMQMLFNGYCCHLSLVYCFDSHLTQLW